MHSTKATRLLKLRTPNVLLWMLPWILSGMSAAPVIHPPTVDSRNERAEAV